MTRAMFVTAIGRLYERSYGSISGNGSISSWATDGAKYCQETKVITGREGGSFIPPGNATRAEVAAVITRFIQTIVK